MPTSSHLTFVLFTSAQKGYFFIVDLACGSIAATTEKGYIKMPPYTVALLDSQMYHTQLWQTDIFIFGSKCRGVPATMYIPLMTSNVASGSYSPLPSSSPSATSSPTDKKSPSTPKGLSKKFSFPRSFSGTTFLSSSRRVSLRSPEPYQSHHDPMDPMIPNAEQTKESALHDLRCAEGCKSTCPYFIQFVALFTSILNKRLILYSRHFTYLHAKGLPHPVSAKQLLVAFYATSDEYTQARERLCIFKTRLQYAELECAWAISRCSTNPLRLMIPPHRFKKRDDAEAKRLHAQESYEEAQAARLERALELFDIGRF